MEEETKKEIDKLLDTFNAGIRSSGGYMVEAAKNCNTRGIFVNHRSMASLRAEMVRKLHGFQSAEKITKKERLGLEEGIQRLDKYEDEVKDTINEECKCELW